MKAVVVLLILTTLPSCSLIDGRRRDESRFEVTQPVQAPPAPIVVKAPDEYTPAIEKLRAESVASSNAIKTDMTGVNLNISKVAESLKLIDGPLADVKNTATASASAVAKLDARLSSSIEATAELKAEIKAQVDIANSLRMQVGQMMLDNKVAADANIAAFQRVEKLQQDVKAGRDAIVQNIELNERHVDLLRSAHRTEFWTVVAFLATGSFVCCVLLHNSRKRAEMRYDRERAEKTDLMRVLAKGRSNADA